MNGAKRFSLGRRSSMNGPKRSTVGAQGCMSAPQSSARGAWRSVPTDSDSSLSPYRYNSAAAAPTAAGSGDPTWQYQRRRTPAAAVSSGCARACPMAGRVGRPSGLPASLGSVRQPRRRARHPRLATRWRASINPREAVMTASHSGHRPASYPSPPRCHPCPTRSGGDQ